MWSLSYFPYFINLVPSRPIIFVWIIWDRNDAGLAAAELALAVEKHVLESGSIDTVDTVGMSYPFSTA